LWPPDTDTITQNPDNTTLSEDEVQSESSNTALEIATFWGSLWDPDLQAVVPDPFGRRRDCKPHGLWSGAQLRHLSYAHLPPYKYGPLEENNSIRILCLEAGTGSDELSLHLQHTILSNPSLDFEALSYSWGASGGKFCRIQNPEGVIHVSTTLEQALRRVRRADGPRYIWVDSICINQEDETEKGHQVKLMCEIYQRATSVLVWLGSAQLHQSIGAFSILAAVASHGGAAGQPVGKAHFKSNGVSSASIPNLPGEYGPPPLDSELWRFVADLYERPWFRRVWCIQEIAVARTATVLWGDAEISWRWLGLATARIRVNLCPFITRYDLSGVFNAYLMYRLSQGDAKAAPTVVSFLELLAMTCQFEVSDCRDRVYGLLGLPTTDSDPCTGNLFVDPDYTLKLDEVYWNVATRVLKLNGSLKILCSVQHNGGISHPSWMPWWEGVRTSMLAQFTGKAKLDASAGVPADYELLEDEKKLRARGICLGTVMERFGPIPRLDMIDVELNRSKAPDTDTIRYSGLQTFFHADGEELSQDNTISATTTPKSPPTHSLSNLLRDSESQKYLCFTLTAGRNWQGLLAYGSEQHMADFAAFLHESPETREFIPLLPSGNASRFVEAMRNVTAGRRLFSIEPEGEIGLGPDMVQPGDQICLLFGCPAPLCLRYQNGGFVLIGECYLHNYTQGQAIELWRKGKLQTDFFEIY